MTNAIRRLSRDQLLAALRRALRNANEAIAALIQCMAEVDQRRLYLREGYPSMFAYCVGELNMSEDTAYKRIRVARLIRRFPAALAPLEKGEVHLRGLTLLAPHIKKENSEELLELAKGQPRKKLEQLLAERFPKPDARQLLRKLPARRGTRPRIMATNPAPPEAARGAQEASSAGRSETLALHEASPPAARRHEVEALGNDRFKVQFTVDEATYKMLKELQDLLGHAVPQGDIAEISRRAYALLLEKTLKQKYAVGVKARGSEAEETAEDEGHEDQQTAGATRRRYVPAKVRRAVWERDEGRCTYVGRNGRRCEETRFIEMNHRRPFANGGGNTIANLELRCHAHNQMQAREDFGVSVADVSRRAS